ncbi:hypothetical protein ACFR97_10375 [Haloplanus litoreus]|uniref:Small CPxCG-related zinc finger protein n=1 Tax=Haloplanus litoreus TaxID=767515 RepID=A0ABD6A1R0_9EURY
MMPGSDFRSFADPDTEFVLDVSETPRTVDGFKPGEPTGKVICPHCGEAASAPEYIPHPENCRQSGVTSEWYERTH